MEDDKWTPPDYIVEDDEENEELVQILGSIGDGIPTCAMYYTSDKWRRDEFAEALDFVLKANRAIREAIEGIHGKAEVSNIADCAALLLACRSFKAALKETAKVVNRKLPGLEERLCFAIAEAGLLKASTETHTFTAKARAYLNRYPKPDGEGWEEFKEWFTHHPNQDIADLMRLQVDRRALEKLCQDLQEAGEQLPPHVQTFIKATVGVRRKPG